MSSWHCHNRAPSIVAIGYPGTLGDQFPCLSVTNAFPMPDAGLTSESAKLRPNFYSPSVRTSRDIGMTIRDDHGHNAASRRPSVPCLPTAHIYARHRHADPPDSGSHRANHDNLDWLAGRIGAGYSRSSGCRAPYGAAEHVLPRLSVAQAAAAQPNPGLTRSTEDCARNNCCITKHVCGCVS